MQPTLGEHLSFGAMSSGLSRLPSMTNTRPGNVSRLLVNSRAPQFGQKFRFSPLPDSAM